MRHHYHIDRSGPTAAPTGTDFEPLPPPLQLPGFPDGISRASDGGYWLCLVAPLSPLVRSLPLYPDSIRRLLGHVLVSPLAKSVSHPRAKCLAGAKQ